MRRGEARFEPTLVKKKNCHVRGKQMEPKQTFVDSFARYLFFGASWIDSRGWRTRRVWRTNATLAAPFTSASKANTDGKKAISLVKGETFLLCPVRFICCNADRVAHLRKPRVWNVYFGEIRARCSRAIIFLITSYPLYGLIIPYAYTSQLIFSTVLLR